MNKRPSASNESLDVDVSARAADNPPPPRYDAAVSDEELRTAVRAAIAGGATQIGAVMGKVLPQFKGRAEGGTINAIAREELSKQG